MRARVEEVRRLISTPQSIALRDLLLLDPLGIAQVFLDGLADSQGQLRVDWTQGYFVSDQRDMVLLIARPVEPAQEVEFGRRLVASVDSVVAELTSSWPEIAGEGGSRATTSRRHRRSRSAAPMSSR